jgi:hypothetical protein
VFHHRPTLRCAQAPPRLRERGATRTVGDAADAEGPFELILESVGGESMTAAIERVAPGHPRCRRSPWTNNRTATQPDPLRPSA